MGKKSRRHLSRAGLSWVCGLTTLGMLSATQVVRAERITNKIAVFAALDKVTARISRLEVELNKTAVFGTLKVTPRACFTRPPTEPPKTTAFVEVQDVKLDGTIEPNFSGWMFAQSPGLHAVEHPVFDVWLTDCTGPAEAVAADAGASTEPAAVGDDGQLIVRKRRPKRQ